jgi:hypothetical protein
MNRPRTFRLLRIAFSVVCGIVCLLLIALWVRSYSCIDSIHGIGYPKEIWCESLRGELGFLLLPRYAGQPRNISFTTRTPDRVPYYSTGLYDDWQVPFSAAFGIRWTFVGGFGLVIPCWTAVIFIATVATAPWIPWSCRFSLRTLLIATTLVAVVLGIVVLASR